MPRRMRRAPRGVTLIELVIAITVLSIGTLAAMRALDATQRDIGDQTARALAHQVALNRAAELRALGIAAQRDLPDSVEMGPFTWRVAVTESEAAGGLVEADIRVTSPDRPGARLVAPLAAEPGP